MSQEIDLTNYGNEDLVYFLAVIIPRHAAHIQAVAFSQTDMGRSAVPPYVASAAAASAVAELGEPLVVIGEDVIAHTDLDTAFRQRCSLLAKAIDSLPKLVKVDCDFVHGMPGASASELDPSNDLGPLASYPLVSRALLRMGDRLTDLELANDDEEEGAEPVCTEEHLGNFLRLLPGLERLALALDLFPRGRETLLDGLVSLKHLTYLSIDSGPFVDDEFARASWTCPLLELSLVTCDAVSFPSLLTFLGKFSSTLAVLRLDEVPSDATTLDASKLLGRPWPLPKLRALFLSTLHPAAFLGAFPPSVCKLRDLAIGFCPAIAYAEWEAFLASHQRSLRTVVVSGEAELTDAHVESLEVWCHAKGVECVVEPPDSDSESEGEEGSEMEEEGRQWEDEVEGDAEADEEDDE